ncbi:MAG: putative metal-binding motif-containing protein [Labilithrix sp.]|nr:putative metal-binding motif-containing protein [Labilithrix sp.]
MTRRRRPWTSRVVSISQKGCTMFLAGTTEWVRFWKLVSHAGLLLAVLVGVHLPRVAAAEIVCDAGTVCPDSDNDGFAACGCPWSGTPCDCDDTDPTIFPGAPETCDSTRDNNCTGIVADPCPKKTGCLDSTCVPACIPLDDFGCPWGSGFAHAPDSGTCLCKPDDCAMFGCPAGLTCDDAKACVANCNPGVRCPHGQICRGFGCVDPCAEVTCPEGAICKGGRCLPSCACDPASSCPPGETCDLSAPIPACVETACVGVRCPAGSHCERGACIDDCEGVVCPPKRVCKKVSVNGDPAQAKCVDLCSPDPCKVGEECDWRTGMCTLIPLPEGGGLIAPPELVDPLDVAGAGWLCTTSGLAHASAIAVITSAGAVLMFALRRRGRGATRRTRPSR